MLYALPSRLGPAFVNDEGFATHDEYGVLLTVLPLVMYPERHDAMLLHAILQVA